MALWLLAFKNLFRNPRRNIVTSLAIAIGFAGLNVFNGYAHRTERALAVATIYNNHVGHISILKKGWLEKGLSKPKRHSINRSEQLEFNNFLKPFESELLFKIPLFVGTGLISNGCRSLPFFFKGLERNYRTQALQAPEFLKWSTDSKEKFLGKDYTSFQDADAPLMITRNLAQLLNKKTVYLNSQSLPPSQIPDCQNKSKKEALSMDPSIQLLTKNFEGGFSAIDANIVGHYVVGLSFLDDISIEGPISLTQKLFDTESYSRLLLFLKDPQRISHWKEKIQPEFQTRFPNFEMVFYDDPRISPFYAGTSSFFKSLTFLFIIISGISVILTIINSLTISIIERSKEIGTLRAIGFTPSQIAELFGREMLILTSLSLTIGSFQYVLVSYLINLYNFSYSPPGTSTPVKLEIAFDFNFQILTFFSFVILVFIVSYWLSCKRININTARLLVDS